MSLALCARSRTTESFHLLDDSSLNKIKRFKLHSRTTLTVKSLRYEIKRELGLVYKLSTIKEQEYTLKKPEHPQRNIFVSEPGDE